MAWQGSHSFWDQGNASYLLASCLSRSQLQNSQGQWRVDRKPSPR